MEWQYLFLSHCLDRDLNGFSHFSWGSSFIYINTCSTSITRGVKFTILLGFSRVLFALLWLDGWSFRSFFLLWWSSFSSSFFLLLITLWPPMHSLRSYTSEIWTKFLLLCLVGFWRLQTRNLLKSNLLEMQWARPNHQFHPLQEFLYWIDSCKLSRIQPPPV